MKEGVHIGVTYGGSPGLYTGYLKERDFMGLPVVSVAVALLARPRVKRGR